MVDLYLDRQAIDTTTAGRMFFHVTGAFAEFERDMIRSRVNAGLARAKARGVKLGRPKVSAKGEAAIKERLAAGVGILKTARTVGVGSGTVQRIKAELAASATKLSLFSKTDTERMLSMHYVLTASPVTVAH
jgi:DNA invertase Pin-like site-specific DNA recombinase